MSLLVLIVNTTSILRGDNRDHCVLIIVPYGATNIRSFRGTGPFLPSAIGKVVHIWVTANSYTTIRIGEVTRMCGPASSSVALFRVDRAKVIVGWELPKDGSSIASKGGQGTGSQLVLEQGDHGGPLVK